MGHLIVLWPVFVQADGGASTLREAYDPGLQSRLEARIDGLGLARPVTQRHLAVVLADISDLDEPRLAALNGDEMMYAASLPKIAILLAAFLQAEHGRLVLDRPTRASLTAMIRVSSNVEATRMLNRIGKGNVIEILRSDRLRLYDPAVNGGLWVGKEYGKAPAYRRDPLHNLSHGATAMQAARFYYLLESGRLLSPPLAVQMKRMLGNPGIPHKFVKGLAEFPDVRIYRKSGSWQRWHADSALVESGPYRYILVALAEDRRGGGWLEGIARAAHRLVVPARRHLALNTANP